MPSSDAMGEHISSWHNHANLMNPEAGLRVEQMGAVCLHFKKQPVSGYPIVRR